MNAFKPFFLRNLDSSASTQHIHHKSRPKRSNRKHLCWWHQDTRSKRKWSYSKSQNWTCSRIWDGGQGSQSRARSRKPNDKALSAGVYLEGADKNIITPIKPTLAILQWKKSPSAQVSVPKQPKLKERDTKEWLLTGRRIFHL